MAAGVALVVERMAYWRSVEGAVVPQVLFILDLLLLALGLIGFHRLQREHYGRLGLIAFSLTMVGLLGMSLFRVVELAGAQRPIVLEDVRFS